MKLEIEYTDTFSGEANYSWVQRYFLELPENTSERSIILAAKKLAGLTGVPCKKTNLGELVALYPLKSCTVLFITQAY